MFSRAALLSVLFFSLTSLSGPLHQAVWDCDISRVVELLDGGAGVNEPDADGALLLTPLHIAAWVGAADIARVLLERGANPQIRDENGILAIDTAREFEHHDVVREIHWHPRVTNEVYNANDMVDLLRWRLAYEGINTDCGRVVVGLPVTYRRCDWLARWLRATRESNLAGTDRRILLVPYQPWANHFAALIVDVMAREDIAVGYFDPSANGTIAPEVRQALGPQIQFATLIGPEQTERGSNGPLVVEILVRATLEILGGAPWIDFEDVAGIRRFHEMLRNFYRSGHPK